MRINTNVSALNALRNLGNTEDAVGKSMEKLSSGFRINRAGDDAAGLGIANKLSADIRSVTQSSRNAEQAGSVLQIMDGATSTVQQILERMKELATEANSDSVDSTARTRINTEFGDLKSEIDRIAATTKFQNQALVNGGFGATVDTASTVLASGKAFQAVTLSGAAAGSYSVTQSAAGQIVLFNGSATQTATASSDGVQTLSFSQLGISLTTNTLFDKDATQAAQGAGGALNITVTAGSGAFMVSSSGDYTGNDKITLSSVDVRTSTLAISTSALDTSANAASALTAIDTAIGTLNTYVGTIGSAENRVNYALTNSKTTIQNFAAAESVIKDVDMAQEMTSFSKNQILAQAGTAMLAQANQLGAGVLQLLK